MDLSRGDVVYLEDAPQNSYKIVGYEPSTAQVKVESNTGEIKYVDQDSLLKPTDDQVKAFLKGLVDRKADEDVVLRSEKVISAETYTEEQKTVGLKRAELIHKFESGKIETRDKLMAEMGLKDTAFEEVMRRWNADPRWQSVVPKLPGRIAGKSDQDPAVVKLYMEVFSKKFEFGVTQKRLYMMFEHECREKGVEPFSRSTANRIFRSIDPRKREMKSEGPDFANKKFSPYPSSFEIDRPLRRIQIDSTHADIMVVDDKTGKCLGRPYLTTVCDDFSGGILAALITFVPPCRATIAAALFQAFTPKTKLLADLGLAGHRWTLYGAPAGILMDKGPEHYNYHLQQTCDMWGVACEYRKRPEQGGKAENSIKLVNNFFIHGLPGSTGSKPKKSPDFQPHKKAQFDLKQLQRLVILEVIRLNDEARGSDGKSPNGRWDEWFADPNTPLFMPPIMRNALGFMINMLPGGRVYVKREGIKYGGYVYDHGPVRHLVEREVKVSVRRSPLDLRSLYVLHDGIWTIAPALKPNSVPGTLIEAQIWKRLGLKPGDQTKVGHDAITAIQDIIASTPSARQRLARASESVDLAGTMSFLPTPVSTAPPASPKKTETNRYANIRPYKGEDD